MLATILLSGLPELLRFAAEWRIAIYCVIVLLIINYRTSGIMGERELTWSAVRRLWTRKGAERDA